MPDDLHGFITGTLWLKLKEDVRDFRVFNRHDLACAAYFHIRRVIQPGWYCRADVGALGSSELALFSDGKPRALLQLEFHLTRGMTGGFPTAVMNEKMATLRQAVDVTEPSHAANSGKAGRGYLVAVYDTEEEWFYPAPSDQGRCGQQAVWEKQSCFWLPVNCRAFADYAEWHQKWERLARLSNQ